MHTGQLHPASWPTGTANPKQVAVDDLREGLLKLVKEFGAPQELTLTLPTAACDSLAGPTEVAANAVRYSKLCMLSASTLVAWW